MVRFWSGAGGKPADVKAYVGVYRNCRITLDSPEDGEYLNSSLLKGLAGINFDRCLVVYHGGPVKLILAWDQHVLGSTTVGNGAAARISTSGNTLRFVDCIFDFSIQESPTKETQQLTQFLLNQTTSTIAVPVAATHS